MIKYRKIANAIIIGGALMISACGGNKPAEESKELTGDIKIDGSSTVYPLTEAVAEEFRVTQPKVKVTVGVSGTGGGFKKFARNETDMSNASRPIKKEEIEACKTAAVEFIELPIAYDGLAIVINKENTWVDHLTVEELKKLWEPEAQGKIMKWNQIRPEWPDMEIHLFGAGVASGTYDYFTESIVGKDKGSRGDYNASEDDNVLVQGVSTDKGGLGFFGLGYFEENKDKLKLVAIDDKKEDNGAGAILPTVETVSNGTYQPLSRPEFIYVNAKSADRPEVVEFVNFYLTNAPALSKEVGSVPLSTEEYSEVKKRFDARVKGSMFENVGSAVGVKLIDVIKGQVSK